MSSPFGPMRSKPSQTIQVSTKQAEKFRDEVVKIIERFVEEGVQGGDPAYWDILKPLADAVGKDLILYVGEARNRINQRRDIS